MVYLYDSLDKPTRLYIKKCSHCGMKYFGKTVSKNIEKYTGSGIYWNNHLKKYNAEAVHLWHSAWYHDTSITRFALKFSSVNQIVKSDLWANQIPENGIDGDWRYVNDNGLNRTLWHLENLDEHMNKISILGIEKKRWLLENDEVWTEKYKENLSIANKKQIKEFGNPFQGKTHREETKRMIGSANSAKQRGENNSQYGTVWITNGSDNKKIKKNDDIPNGWYKGRVINIAKAQNI